MHLAVASKDLNLVQEILKHPNIDVSIRSKAGSTVLDFALKVADQEMIKLIKQKIEDTKKLCQTQEQVRILDKKPRQFYLVSEELLIISSSGEEQKLVPTIEKEETEDDLLEKDASEITRYVSQGYRSAAGTSLDDLSQQKIKENKEVKETSFNFEATC